jgi:hypothetical protein
MNWLVRLFCQHEWRNQYEMADGTTVLWPERSRADYRVYRCLKCPKIFRQKFFEFRYPPRPPQ